MYRNLYFGDVLKRAAAISNISTFCEYSPNNMLDIDSSYQTRREMLLNLSLVFFFFFLRHLRNYNMNLLFNYRI